jgi:pimeloyl-ACP methyl ester carboxylesterase
VTRHQLLGVAHHRTVIRRVRGIILENRSRVNELSSILCELSSASTSLHMNALGPCGQLCSTPCHQAEACEAPGPTLGEVLARFEREAQRGVCDTGRYRMPFYTWGSGPPLVFVHGVGDTSRSFLLPIARLSAHFHCVAYDLPSGHGDGARLFRYRHDDLVDDLWALLDHLAVPRAYLLGASFGSTVALRALVRRPERLPRAVLQGAVVHRPLRRAERWLSWLARFLPGPARRIPKREKILEVVHKETFAQQPDEVWRAFVDWTGQSRLSALGHQAQWLHRLDLRPELPQVRQPVLLVWGERDRVVPLAHADVLRQGLPAAGLAVLEGAGHVPSYTHPDALAGVVRQFLTPAAPCPAAEAAS